MGVYIPNMEKPKSCEDCPLTARDEWEDLYCVILTDDILAPKDIMTDCPLIEIGVPKVGRWIPYKAYFGKKKDSWVDELKCSECGYGWGDEGYNYCPNCGARMKGASDEHNTERD